MDIRLTPSVATLPQLLRRTSAIAERYVQSVWQSGISNGCWEVAPPHPERMSRAQRVDSFEVRRTMGCFDGSAALDVVVSALAPPCSFEEDGWYPEPFISASGSWQGVAGSLVGAAIVRSRTAHNWTIAAAALRALPQPYEVYACPQQMGRTWTFGSLLPSHSLRQSLEPNVGNRETLYASIPSL